MLPTIARRGILEPCLVALRSIPEHEHRRGVVPLTAEAWETVIHDIGLNDLERWLPTAVDSLRSASTGSDPKQLARAGTELVRLVEAATEHVRHLDDYVVSEGLGREIAAHLRDVGLAALEAATDDRSTIEVELARRDLTDRLRAVNAISLTSNFPADTCEIAFGVRAEELRDGSGTFSPTRLLAAFYGRYEELDRRLNDLASLISPSPVGVIQGITCAEAVLLAPRPLVSLRTARRVYHHLRKGLEDNPELVSAALHDLRDRADRSETSHRTTTRLLLMLQHADTDAERAEVTLDIYRRVVEGQLRPWAWALLRIGGRDVARPPELSALRDQLVADGAPLMLDAANCILPLPRNASAHEDYAFDHEVGALVVGDSNVEVAELERASGHAYSFMMGAECAWASARHGMSGVVRGPARSKPRALALRSAITFFGANGLKVSRYTMDHHVLTVEIDALPQQRINPCIQAAMWATREISDIQRVDVTLPSAKSAVLALPRAALDATHLVWRRARVAFTEMPVSVFLAANAAARTAAETPGQAAQAVAWIGVNDAVNAYDEAHSSEDPIGQRFARLIDRLSVVADGLASAMTVLPSEATPLAEALEAVTVGTSTAFGAFQGREGRMAEFAEDQIRSLHAAMPVVAYLPTVDASAFG